MLKPGNAVAAIILCHDRYLLQLRDDVLGIFFPNHWGLFGGELEYGESEIDALRREIFEELGISFNAYRHLMSFNFDLTPLGIKSFYRSFYEVQINAETYSKIVLSEGQKFELIKQKDLFSLNLTPYDHFALWWHAQINPLDKVL